MADALQDLSLESDFLQQLLSAGAEVALSYRLRTDNGAAVRGGGPGPSFSFTLQTPISHLKTIKHLIDSRNMFWGGWRYFPCVTL